MKKAIRVFTLTSVILFALACATCHFGVEHEISKIPPDVRARMSDTDWVGAQWVFRGMGIWALSLSSLLVSVILRLFQKNRIRNNRP